MSSVRQSSGATRLKVLEVTEVTRRSIFDALALENIPWYGRLKECEFAARIFNTTDLPSDDKRFTTAYEDIQQHRDLNNDWPEEWILTDPRFNLLHSPLPPVFPAQAGTALLNEQAGSTGGAPPKLSSTLGLPAVFRLLHGIQQLHCAQRGTVITSFSFRTNWILGSSVVTVWSG